jgi:hypothetical protein
LAELGFNRGEHKKTLKAYFQEKVAFFDKTFLSESPDKTA